MDKREAVIVAYGRAPVGKAKKGAYVSSHPIEYAGQTLKGVIEKIPNIDINEIGCVIVGCAQPFGTQGSGLPRMIANRAGLPKSIPAFLINSGCSSSLQAISEAANAIKSGQEDIVIAGGVEDMTHIVMGKRNPEDLCKWIQENAPEYYVPMGITGENVAEKYNVSRTDMEDMAVESHRRACEAIKNGEFEDQIIPISIVDDSNCTYLNCVDQGPRENVEKISLEKLNPCFKPDGKLTAATSSQMSDGASFVVITSYEKALELGVKPIARCVSFKQIGVSPEIMGIGPMLAVPAVLKRAGLTLEDIDVIELNEAFASQSIAVLRKLGLKYDKKINPNGGALALGHPMGATGANLTCKALSYLQKHGGRYAMVTMCVGGGMGAAFIYEML